MVVVSLSSDLNHTEMQSETDPSVNPTQDIQVKAVERGMVSLKSKIQKNLELILVSISYSIPSYSNILELILKWKDTNVLELRRRAEKEVSQLLTLANKLIDEELESFPNQLDRYCSDVIRKCPERIGLFFGRKNTFLKNVAQWAQSTYHTLSEKEEQYKSRVASQRREHDGSNRCRDELEQMLAKVKERHPPEVYGMLTNIPRRHIQYETIPQPLYGHSEEPVGEHFMVKVNMKLENGQEVVQVHPSRTKTVHSYSGASAASPPEMWVNQIRGYRDSPQLSCIAQLFGYNQSGKRYDLLFHGSLIPFEDQLRRLHDTQPLRRVELISKTTWELKSVCSYFRDELDFNPDDAKSGLYWFLTTMLHFNEDKEEMVICGDLSEWERDSCGDIIGQSRDAAKLRLPTMFTASLFVESTIDKRPQYPDYSKAQNVSRDLPTKEQQRLVLDFYEALAHTFEATGPFDIPSFMRGIHIDPRIHKPCSRSWCRPMVDIWDDTLTGFIGMPRPYNIKKVPHYQPESQFSVRLPQELTSAGPPHYLQVLSSLAPHEHGDLDDPSPVSLTRSSCIWFSQAARVFSSPQFKKSGLRKSDITYVKTTCLHSAWMIDPSESGGAIPDDLTLELSSFEPYMDMNGIHVGPTKWATNDPLHHPQLCQSSWTIQKCFYCTARGYYWDDAAYKALDDFHRSLGMDPSSDEIAEFLGYPLLDIDELLHKSGWTCSHPTIKDSVIKHTLSCKDLEGAWDPSINCPNSMVMDGISKMNMKMRKHFEDGYMFSGKDLQYSSCPPTMFSRHILYWVILVLKFISVSILGWPM